jgi:hypothetical protein
VENIQILSHELNDADSSTAIIQRSPFSKCVPKKTINNLYKKNICHIWFAATYFCIKKGEFKKRQQQFTNFTIIA